MKWKEYKFLSNILKHHRFFEVTLKAQDQLQKISGLRQPAVNERIPSLLSMQFPWLLLQSLLLLLPDVT